MQRRLARDRDTDERGLERERRERRDGQADPLAARVDADHRDAARMAAEDAAERVGVTTRGLYGGTSCGHGAGRLGGMCRNIKTLHNFDPPASEDEVRAAALQYVRKVSGSAKPSQANEAAFMRAVDEIAHITAHLLDDLVTSAVPARPRGRGCEGARPGGEAVRQAA